MKLKILTYKNYKLLLLKKSKEKKNFRNAIIILIRTSENKDVLLCHVPKNSQHSHFLNGLEMVIGNSIHIKKISSASNIIMVKVTGIKIQILLLRITFKVSLTSNFNCY